MSDVKVKGLSELQAALDSLPAKIEANIMRGALRAGANVIRAEAKALVPHQSGTLADSIRTAVSLRRGTVTASVRAGGRGKNGKASAYYAHMVEGGTKAHIIKARPGSALNLGGTAVMSVQHPGAKARPFMRPAFDSRQQQAVEAVREYIRTRLATKHGIDVPGPGNENDSDDE
jgi:HK97 gp10 family phage protein